MSMIT